MASIRRLAPSVSDELRASLVVHSLDQCTAELIQNSIDANATMIEIKIDVAGHSLQVSDNGDGITSTDMARIGTRYATSKCSTLQDLNHITTYGFRGEAMAAITEMALVDIVSRPKEQEHVYSTIFKGGDRLFCGPSSKCPRFNHGTTISVRDLFYKFPVRQRYWSDATPSKIETELEKVKRVVETLAMVAPEISFTLIDISRDSKIFSCRQVDSLLRRITTILGLSIASSLSFVKSSREIDQVYQLSGYISTQAHYNRMCQYIFLNQRPVQCENLRKLVVYLFQQSSFATDSVAYSQQTSAQLQDVRRSKERHPIFILILTCPTSEYDLCADPSKVTIQFEDEERAFHVIRCTIIDFLERHHLLSRTAATALRFQKGPRKRKQRCSTPSVDLISDSTTPLDYISRVKTSRPSRTLSPLSHQSQTLCDRESCNGIDLEDELEFEMDADWIATMFDDDFVMGEVEYTRQGPQGLLLPQSISQRSKFSRVSLPHSSAPGSKPFSTSISGIWAQDALCKWVNPVFPTAPTQIPALESLRLDSAGISNICEHDPLSIRRSRFFNSKSMSQTGETLNIKSVQLSKSSLQRAKVISQLDRKFILCTMEQLSSDNRIEAQDFNQQEQMQEHRTVNKVLAVIDQHAADERVRVERLMKKMCTCSLPDPRDVRDSRLGFTELGIGSSTIVSHQLDSMDMVPPLPITLSRREWHLAKLSAEWLHRWGIVLKETASQGNTSNPFDDEAEIGLETVMVSQHFPNDMMMEEDTIGSSIERGHKANKRAVSGTSRSGVDSDFRSGFVVSLPRIISDRCVVDSSLTHDLVKDALSSFEEGRYRPRHMNPGDTQAKTNWLRCIQGCPRGILDIVNSKACRGAIMFNDEMSLAQCRDLVHQLAQCTFPFQCAHGRPSIVPLTILDRAATADNSNQKVKRSSEQAMLWETNENVGNRGIEQKSSSRTHWRQTSPKQWETWLRRK